MNILITGVGGPAGKALVAQLATTGHSVIGVDMEEISLSNLDAFELVPPASDPAMIGQLAQLVRDYDIDLFIPTVADELPSIAKATNQGLFEPAKVVIGKQEAVKNCFDKYLTMMELRAAGVAVPPFGLPSDFTSADDAFTALGGAIISKPRVARGGRGFQVHHDVESFDLARFDDSTILQAYAPGEEYAPMLYLDNHNVGAETVALVTKIKEQFCETSAPIVAPIDTAAALDVALLAVQAGRALKLSGPVDLDVRRMADGRPVILEVNARFGANSRLAPDVLERVLEAYS